MNGVLDLKVYFIKYVFIYLAEMNESKNKNQVDNRMTGRQFFEINQDFPIIDSDDSGDCYD